MQVNDKQPISVKKFFKFAGVLFGGLFCIISLIYVVWPGLLFYLLIIFLGGETNHSCRAAEQLGKRGDVFLIALSMRSSSTEIQEVVSGFAIREYLVHNGPTDAIWDVITRELIYQKTSGENKIYVTQCLEEYVYGPYVFVPKLRTSIRSPFFSKDKIRWANANIFNRIPDYGLPDESDEAQLKSYETTKKHQ